MSRSSPVPAVVAALTASAGVAPHSELVACTSASAVRAAVAAGAVARLGYGLYALAEIALAEPVERAWADHAAEPTEAEQRAAARNMGVARAHAAVLSHRSAAAHYGWTMFTPPTSLDLTVDRERRVRSGAGLRMRHGRTTEREREERVTEPVRTVIECAAELPFPEGLAIADSALRAKTVGPSTLLDAADRYRGRHAVRVRRVAHHTDGRADNPFESVVRAHTLDVPGFTGIPQYEITDGAFSARVDLADVALRIVIEADSHTYHGTREAFEADVIRYTRLVALDWTVVRFTLAQARAGTPVVDALTAVTANRARYRAFDPPRRAPIHRTGR